MHHRLPENCFDVCVLGHALSSLEAAARVTLCVQKMLQTLSENSKQLCFCDNANISLRKV